MIRDILQFTVPNISNAVTNNIEILVDQILSAKKENPQADTSALERQNRFNGVQVVWAYISRSEIGG